MNEVAYLHGRNPFTLDIQYLSRGLSFYLFPICCTLYIIQENMSSCLSSMFPTSCQIATEVSERIYLL